VGRGDPGEGGPSGSGDPVNETRSVDASSRMVSCFALEMSVLEG
jgi:hypothetical protein